MWERIVLAVVGSVVLAASSSAQANSEEGPLNKPVDPASFTSWHETLQDVVNGAVQRLDNLLLFMVLVLVLLVLICLAHVFHREVKVTLTALVILCLVLGAGAAYGWSQRNTSALHEQRLATADSVAAFLALGDKVDLGPFRVSLVEIDTLKTDQAEDGTPAWVWNQRFGRGALERFLEVGQARLVSELRSTEECGIRQWPESTFFTEISGHPEPQLVWNGLLEKLDCRLTSKITNRGVKLRSAFSKWPLARLEISYADRVEVVAEGFYPAQSRIRLVDHDGNSHELVLTAVFNGDRDIGEPEACTLELSDFPRG